MLFTLELQDIGLCFRLQKDGSWRNCTTDSRLRDTDYTSSDPTDITTRSTAKGSLELEGKIYEVDPDQIEFPSEQANLFQASSIFRRKYPMEPDREQLKQVIAAGDDQVNNCLILNANGKFELRQSPPFNQLLNNPFIIVRHETSIQGNGYVGLEASKDDRLIDHMCYWASLEHWKNHLRYHCTQEYSDIPATQTIEEIKRELDKIRIDWVPDY